MKRSIRIGIAGALILSAMILVRARYARAASDPSPAQERRQLFLRGAELWPIYCNTCHNARPGSEFSPVEWNMIIMHMRTQANLPPQDAKAILEYLKASR
jgi:hypothetical protein